MNLPACDRIIELAGLQRLRSDMEIGETLMIAPKIALALNEAARAIEEAPHGQLCEVILFDGDRCEHLLKCDCWKRTALDRINELLTNP